MAHRSTLRTAQSTLARIHRPPRRTPTLERRRAGATCRRRGLLWGDARVERAAGVEEVVRLRRPADGAARLGEQVEPRWVEATAEREVGGEAAPIIERVRVAGREGRGDRRAIAG